MQNACNEYIKKKIEIFYCNYLCSICKVIYKNIEIEFVMLLTYKINIFNINNFFKIYFDSLEFSFL